MNLENLYNNIFQNEPELDLIDRKALLRQIEADSEGQQGWYGDEWKFIESIEKMPSIKIVRCKDCEYYGKTNDNCARYLEVFFSIKQLLDQGGEIILRAKVADIRGEE